MPTAIRKKSTWGTATSITIIWSGDFKIHASSLSLKVIEPESYAKTAFEKTFLSLFCFFSFR
jgi:hypothetical protein